MDANNFRCDNAECGCHVTSFQWISEPLQAIYFESSKCCSSSIRNRLGIGTCNFGIEGVKFGKHKWTNLQGFKEDPERWASYFKFGFVRNSWDKMVSVWAMYTTNESKMHTFSDFFGKPAQEVTFKEFLYAIPAFKNHHWELQTHMIPECVDFVGRFESFGADWQAVCDRIGLVATIGRANSTAHRNFREYYTPELKSRVAELYAPDIKRFGHEFGD